MILPRRLMKLEDGRFCEEHDPKQAMNYRPKGFIISDAEAEHSGLKAYLDATGWGETANAPESPVAVEESPALPEEKAVAQAEVEDKAVEAPTEIKDDTAEQEEPGPGLHVQPESRRIGGGRRGGA